MDDDHSEELLWGTKEVDKFQAWATKNAKKAGEWYKDASADQSGLTDDMLRLLGGGAKNVAWASELPGIKQGLQLAGAAGHYGGILGGKAAELAGVDPRIGGFAGNVIGDVALGGAVAKVGKIGALKGAHKLVKTDLPGSQLAGKGLTRHYIGKAADAKRSQLRLMKREVGGQSQAMRRGELNLQGMGLTEAAEHWGKVTKTPVDQLGISGLQKQSDTALSRVVRYVEEGRADQLSKRNVKAVISTQIESSPLKYLVKYHGGNIMKADSHHILDIDFWGRALDTPSGETVSKVLWKNKVHTGNAGNNIVWTWASKRGHLDHDSLHRVYDQLPSRVSVEELMSNGRWATLTAKTQAKMLRQVAYDQHRVTNNFFAMKLNFVKRAHPDLIGLHKTHLRNKILKDPDKYGQVPLEFNGKLFNPKNPDEVTELMNILLESPHTGGVSAEVREVFGLDTPKAGAKKYHGSAAQKDFDLNLDYRIRKAERNKLSIKKTKPTQFPDNIQKHIKRSSEIGITEPQWKSGSIDYTWRPQSNTGQIDIPPQSAKGFKGLRDEFFKQINELPSGSVWELNPKFKDEKRRRIYAKLFEKDPRITRNSDETLGWVLNVP